ncbi:MAG: hypothetical protein M3546_11845 [Actinomycetota bacterium]|nr:hypothetical protein [Actinomycetota bacterium]
MTVEQLVDDFAAGQLDLETFKEQLAETAEKEAAIHEAESTPVAPIRRTRDRRRRGPLKLSPEAERELEISRQRIKQAANKARKI